MSDAAVIERIRRADLVQWTGRVSRILPTFIEADGPRAKLGDLCRIEASGDDAQHRSVLAEVVSVQERAIRLSALTPGASVEPGSRVVLEGRTDTIPVGDALLGRAIDGLGMPIDGGPDLKNDRWAQLAPPPTAPMERVSPRRLLETGIRAIDGLLSLDHGQRVGIFAAAGVGKTSLLTQLVNHVDVDRCVICLVGERGREVEALWSNGLAPEVKARSVLVAATSDQPAAARVRACAHAAALAEHWRSEGLQVLLVVDSVTRLAMALREIGLAAGEPPTVRAYTPGVFAAIPRLVERFGALAQGGSITAIMTVLAETDDADDPIAEMMKSLLDGHIVLSRTLAEQAHFPPIDVPRSVSRLANALTSSTHRAAADAARSVLSTYSEARTLIETGIYTAGSDMKIDAALAIRPRLIEFLRQDQGERSPLASTVQRLSEAVGGEHAHER